MPQGSRKGKARHPNNYWTTEEVVLATFLRSREVKAQKIAAILNERYAPKVRHAPSLRNKLLAVRAIERNSGRIDLTYDKNFTHIRNVDRWIIGQIHDAHARSALLTFTEHELEILERIPYQLAFSSEDSLLVPGPNQMPANPATGRREDSLPAVGPSQMPTNHETGRRVNALPAVGPNERPVQSAWPIWDATLEGLFPGLGPPATPGESSFTMQSGAGDEKAHDPYHESQQFKEWDNSEGEEGEDENEEDEVSEDDDDYDHEYRFQRDENDNCWYDEDQEEEDG